MDKPIPPTLARIAAIINADRPVIYTGHGAHTIGEIADYMGISRRSVGRFCAEKIEKGELVEVTVMRQNRLKRSFPVMAYVEPELFKEWRRSRPDIPNEDGPNLE